MYVSIYHKLPQNHPLRRRPAPVQITFFAVLDLPPTPARARLRRVH